VLKAEQLTDMAVQASETAVVLGNTGNKLGALLALNTCAIYTVGAELIGRLDNMHFKGELQQFSSDSRDALIFGKFFTEMEKKDDDTSKGEDSKHDEESTDPAASTEGDRQ
jgi:hypothetical protein